MDKIEFTTTEREALHYWRFHHPHPRVQLQNGGALPEESRSGA